MSTGTIRVSVANLATVIQCGDVSMHFGIPNPKMLLKEKKLQFQALGGGAELTGEGMEYLQKVHLAHSFEKDEITGLYDARFQIDIGRLESVLTFLSNIAGEKDNPYEMDPTRDIIAEISGKEFPEMGTILTPEEASTIEVVYMKTVRQKIPEDGIGTSSRGAEAKVPSRRMFRIYKLVVSRKILRKIEKSPIVRILSEEELSTTDGGSRKGVTKDGLAIADNLFLI